jgi:hypothetical protein
MASKMLYGFLGGAMIQPSPYGTTVEGNDVVSSNRSFARWLLPDRDRHLDRTGTHARGSDFDGSPDCIPSGLAARFVLVD